MTSPLATLSEDTTIRHATPADVSAMHARAHELAQFEKRIDVFVATQSGLHDALFGPASSADAACIWRIYTCNRRSEARDWPPMLYVLATLDVAQQCTTLSEPYWTGTRRQ